MFDIDIIRYNNKLFTCVSHRNIKYLYKTFYTLAFQVFNFVVFIILYRGIRFIISNNFSIHNSH